jgi:hypothetical protein
MLKFYSGFDFKIYFNYDLTEQQNKGKGFSLLLSRNPTQDYLKLLILHKERGGLAKLK